MPLITMEPSSSDRAPVTGWVRTSGCSTSGWPARLPAATDDWPPQDTELLDGVHRAHPLDPLPHRRAKDGVGAGRVGEAGLTALLGGDDRVQQGREGQLRLEAVVSMPLLLVVPVVDADVLSVLNDVADDGQPGEAADGVPAVAARV